MYIFFRSLLLNTVLTAFKPTYIATRAMDFVNLIVASEDDGIEINRLSDKYTYI